MPEYIAKFDEVVKRCNVDEPETMTISRFRIGLRTDISVELLLREVRNLEHAYQIARDYERFKRGPNFSRPESTEITNPNPKPESSQADPGQPDPSPPMICNEDKDEHLKSNNACT